MSRKAFEPMIQAVELEKTFRDSDRELAVP
jgi:hypothetical protein